MRPPILLQVGVDDRPWLWKGGDCSLWEVGSPSSPEATWRNRNQTGLPSPTDMGLNPHSAFLSPVTGTHWSSQTQRCHVSRLRSAGLGGVREAPRPSLCSSPACQVLQGCSWPCASLSLTHQGDVLCRLKHKEKGYFFF